MSNLEQCNFFVGCHSKQCKNKAVVWYGQLNHAVIYGRCLDHSIPKNALRIWHPSLHVFNTLDDADQARVSL